MLTGLIVATIWGGAAEYEWDEAKRRGTLAKHGVDFASDSDLDWETVEESEDKRRNYGERRWIVHGRIGDHLHTLVYARRGERVRIISLRTASQKEFDRYETRARTADG